MIFLHLCLIALSVHIVGTYVFQDFSVSNDSLFSVDDFTCPKLRYDLIGRSLVNVELNSEFYLMGSSEQYARFILMSRPLIRRFAPCFNCISITRVLGQ